MENTIVYRPDYDIYFWRTFSSRALSEKARQSYAGYLVMQLVKQLAKPLHYYQFLSA